MAALHLFLKPAKCLRLPRSFTRPLKIDPSEYESALRHSEHPWGYHRRRWTPRAQIKALKDCSVPQTVYGKIPASLQEVAGVGPRASSLSFRQCERAWCEQAFASASGASLQSLALRWWLALRRRTPRSSWHRRRPVFRFLCRLASPRHQVRGCQVLLSRISTFRGERFQSTFFETKNTCGCFRRIWQRGITFFRRWGLWA